MTRVNLEEKYEKGEGRLLPSFKCFRELYMNKLTQQENMSKVGFLSFPVVICRYLSCMECNFFFSMAPPWSQKI